MNLSTSRLQAPERSVICRAEESTSSAAAPVKPAPLDPPGVGYVAALYVAREIEAAIQATLDAGGAAGVVGLRGMGGVGKTYLARKIAQDFRAAGGQVAWLGLLKLNYSESLDRLAQAFDLSFLPQLSDAQKFAALSYLFQQHRRASSKLLIVLDNAERFEELAALLGLCAGFPVLVTSRTEEAVDQVQYHRLGEMTPDQALDLCRNLLNKRRAGLFDTLPEEDRAALAGLCADLGGHPLGVRLAVAGIREDLAQPRALRQRSLSAYRDALRRQPITLLCSADAADAELQRSVQQCFDWLFHQLPVRDPELGRLAQLLLPLVTILATGPVPLSAASAAAQALVAVVKEAVGAAEPPDWAVALGRLQDRETLTAAVKLLLDIALLTAEEEDPAALELSVSVHPLVREYAFHERAVAAAQAGSARLTPSGPGPEAIALAALRGSAGQARRVELFLDLLQREQTPDVMRALCDLTPELARYCRFVLRDWGVAAALLRDAVARAELLADPARLGLLLQEWGELQLRCADPAGWDRVAEAAQLLASAPSAESQRFAAWAQRLLWFYGDAPTAPAALRARFDQARMWLGRRATEACHELCSALQQDLSAVRDESLSPMIASDAYLRSSFNTNLIWVLADLQGAVQVGASELLAPETGASEILARSAALAARARARHDRGAAVHAEDALNPEAEIAFRLQHGLARLDGGDGDAAGWTQLCDAAAAEARQVGLRGFAVEARRREGLWCLAMRAQDWTGAVREAEALAAAAEQAAPLQPYRGTAFAQAALTLSRILAAAEAEIASLADRLTEQRAAALRHFDNSVIGWLCLAQAALAWRRAAPTAEIVAALLQARGAFRRLGGAPLCAERVFIFLRDAVDQAGPRFEAARDQLSAAVVAPPDAQPWNLARRRPFAPRVRSLQDGRAMRLVEGGWVPGPWSGGAARDIYLHPFYIDETPLTYGDLRRLGLVDWGGGRYGLTRRDRGGGDGAGCGLGRAHPRRGGAASRRQRQNRAHRCGMERDGLAAAGRRRAAPAGGSRGADYSDSRSY